MTPLPPLVYCVPPYFSLAFCVPPFYGLACCVPFNNKNNYFRRFHLHLEDKMTCMSHAHLKTCLLDFLYFDLPKSMFRFIYNAEMTQKSAKVQTFRVI